MLACRIWSITPPGGVFETAPSVEFLAGSAELPPAPTLTSLLEGGLEVVVATAVHSPLGRGSGRLRSHENCCRRANVKIPTITYRLNSPLFSQVQPPARILGLAALRIAALVSGILYPWTGSGKMVHSGTYQYVQVQHDIRQY
jgi:hypothetical protein